MPSPVMSQDLMNFLQRAIDLPDWATKLTITMEVDCVAKLEASGYVDVCDGIRPEWMNKHYEIVDSDDDQIDSSQDNQT